MAYYTNEYASRHNIEAQNMHIKGSIHTSYIINRTLSICNILWKHELSSLQQKPKTHLSSLPYNLSVKYNGIEELNTYLYMIYDIRLTLSILSGIASTC